jgi:hypothetical protein
MLRRPLLLLFSFLLAVSATSAFAWGTRGHQAVANLAYAKLTQKTRADVDRLLALESGATLASISTWADVIRDETTARWHFVNFPRGTCRYDVRRDCPDGQCVVEAVNAQLAVLASNASDEKRLTALKFVVHLVADMHQPLHAGYLDDRGGNRYQVQAFGGGTNLHALWDSGLIYNTRATTAALTARLLALPSADGDLDAAHAAQESCRIVQTSGFYPGRTVDADYVERFTPVMEQQLRVAGARLAAMLNSLPR